MSFKSAHQMPSEHPDTNMVFQEFEVDVSIIKELIFSQNGTVATAIRELVMNSFDAGSPICEINIGPNGFEVIDSGHGFRCRESVEKYFKRFGEPHQEGDAAFGRFRIGRGQIMAFGRVTWHSNAFKMTTDINSAGAGFELVEDINTIVPGCSVSGQFYTPLAEHEVNHVKHEIRKLTRYAEQKIILNGIEINNQLSTWDYEDDELKIKWDPDRGHGVYLYSLGIFVKEVSAYSYGLNADVVTKKALRLNMARNEISENDLLWRKIARLLKERTIELGNASADSGARFDELTRKAIITQVCNQETNLSDVAKMPLIRDYRGHKINLFSLASNSSRPIIIAPEKGSRICERLATTRTAVVLHHDELKVWGQPDLHSLINKIVWYLSFGHDDKRIWWLRADLAKLQIKNFDELAAGFSDSYQLVNLKSLSPRDSAARSALEYASGVMAKRLTMCSPFNINKRAVKAGESQVADAWTDGSTYIAIGKHMLSLLDQGFSGAVQLSLLMLHEYCHDTNDCNSHEHNFEFYEKYHFFSSMHRKTDVVGQTAVSIYNQYNTVLTKKGLSLPESVKGMFSYPVVNRISEYTGTMDGKKGLSNLALILLGYIQSRDKNTDLQVTKKKLILTTPADLEQNFSYKRGRKNLLESLIQAAELDGFNVPDEQELEARLVVKHDSASWKIFTAELLRLRLAVLAAWADKQNHDFSVIEQIAKRKRITVNDLLQLICQDKHSGLNYFTLKSLQEFSLRTGANYSYNFHSDSFFGWQGRQWDGPALSRSKECRFEYAINGIKDIVNGLSNDEERQQFTDAFLSNTLAIQLKTKTN